MQKQKIAIISVLKPVNDSRSFKKMARTLSANESYELHLYGFPTSKTLETNRNIHFHPSKRFNRISLYRFFIPIKIFISLIKLKPQLVICNSHELQLVTCLYKILFGFKISYDIQENYYFNLKYQHVYPPIFRDALAFYVRLKETILAPVFDHFILAESTYANELSFIGQRYTIIENKAIIPDDWRKDVHIKTPTNILFSGTITRSNGILKALSFMKILHAHSKDFHFTIAGHCSDHQVWELIHAKDYDFITFEVSKYPVPHPTILSQIKSSDFGLVCYDLNKSNQSCLPTKVYEYAALGLPMIYEAGANWSGFIKENGIGIQIEFNKIDTDTLANEMSNFNTTPNDQTLNKANWNTEVKKLKTAIDSLLS